MGLLCDYSAEIPPSRHPLNSICGGIVMQWTKPAYTEMRFGFEVTMYICNR